jgi:hypothetical protein
VRETKAVIHRTARVLAVAAICIGTSAAADDPPAATGDRAAAAKEPVPDLHPQPPEPVSPEALEATIRRGVAFLLKDQNKDGSWGSPELTGVEIIAGIGSHHAFGTAVTAMCVSALTEVDDGTDAVRRAIERGEDYLFRELPKVRRDSPMLIYNVWTHAYGIQALVHMDARLPADEARRARIHALIREQFDRLTRYESAQGGWGYYDFGAGTQRPDSASTSFVNAAVLEAMHEAKQIGVEPPDAVVRRAVASTQLQRKPDFTYLYDRDLREMPVWDINRPGGSLGRSQACNLALRLWGDPKITDAVLKQWLDRLITRNGWLDMGRKRPIPHESYFLVAGYFYYFGHYYAALGINQLPSAERPFYQDHLARILMAVQEQDGSWWDYPLYNYHRPYGTSFALMSLRCCRKGGSAEKE